MKKILTILIALNCIICLFAGCANKVAGSEADITGIIKDLSAAFEKNGYQVECAQEAKNILDGTRSIMTLSNGIDKITVQLYAYATAKSAADDISRLNDEGYTYANINGTQGQTTCIDWVDSPHFYVKDNAIVLYVGSNNDICAILSGICGEQVKGMNTAQASASHVSRPEVTISGLTFTVNDKTYDVSKLESSINAIIQCDYITDTVFVLDCHINHKVVYYAFFSVETMNYTNSFYGTNCTWINNILDSVIYALDNTVNDASGKTLYTVEMTETQYIADLKLSQDGKSATISVRDSNSDVSEDTKTYTFNTKIDNPTP